MKRLIVLGGIVVAIAAGISAVALLRRAEGESRWTQLDSVEELGRRFNEDEGAIRIVLLLSPT